MQCKGRRVRRRPTARIKDNNAIDCCIVLQEEDGARAARDIKYTLRGGLRPGHLARPYECTENDARLQALNAHHMPREYPMPRIALSDGTQLLHYNGKSDQDNNH